MSVSVGRVRTCIALNILGGVLEISGFMLVAYELFRTQRREFGTPKVIKLLLRAKDRVTWFVKKLFRRGKTHEISATLTGESHMSGSMRSQFRVGRGKTLEDHLAALEKNFAELDKEVEQHRFELDKAVKDMADDLRAMRAELEQQRKEREEEEKEFLRASISLQWIGIALFVCGTIASVVGNVISCS
jgi:hypothetical protein